MEVQLIVAILLCVAGLIVGGVVAGLVAFKAGIAHRKKEAEVAIGSAEAEAERIRKDAELQADSKKKEALLEAKDEIHRPAFRSGTGAEGSAQRCAAAGAPRAAKGRNPGPQD